MICHFEPTDEEAIKAYLNKFVDSSLKMRSGGLRYLAQAQYENFCLCHLRLCKSRNISQFKKEFLRYAQYENFCLCHIEFS
ncbi:hypothetical protein [Campylobacter troglodytis]|uniref:hypothetical protein n=1 Tax=Campylobacter troglodytis TaxID=654363 RepID=UPI001158AFAB|nr:hypothetical protein [Campylobacter troglodytis]